jgi:hypothetical protein
LSGALDRLVDLVGLMDAKFMLEKKEIDGVTYWLMGYEASGFPAAPTLALSDDWLVIAPVSPASATRFFDTQKQSSGTWSLDRMADLTPKYTGTMTGVLVVDPRSIIQFGLSLMPVGMSALRNAYPELGIDLTKLPKTDVILKNVFPGVAVTTSDEAGIHCTSRYSLPFTNPELGVFAGGGMLSLFPLGLLNGSPIEQGLDLIQENIPGAAPAEEEMEADDDKGDDPDDDDKEEAPTEKEGADSSQL